MRIVTITATLLLIVAPAVAGDIRAGDMRGGAPLDEPDGAALEGHEQLAQMPMNHWMHANLAAAGVALVDDPEQVGDYTYPVPPTEWDNTAATMTDRAFSMRYLLAEQIKANDLAEQQLTQQARIADALEQIAEQGITLEQPDPPAITVDMAPVADAIEHLAERVRELGIVDVPEPAE